MAVVVCHIKQFAAREMSERPEESEKFKEGRTGGGGTAVELAPLLP